MSCWPAGESLAAEAAWPFPPAAERAPLPELAPPATGAWADEASAGAATAPLATAPLAAELLAPLPEQPVSAAIAISASPAGTATRKRVVRMPVGRWLAPGRLRSEVTIGHRGSPRRHPVMGSAHLRGVHPRGRGRRLAREQLAGDPGRRTAGAVFALLGSWRAVGQHHRQPGGAVVRRGQVAEPSAARARARAATAGRQAYRRRGHRRGGNRAEPADEPGGSPRPAGGAAPRGDRPAPAAARRHQAEPPGPRAPPGGQAPPRPGQAQPPLPVRRRLTRRKSTRLNSSHVEISYAVFCLKKKKTNQELYTIKKKTANTTTNRS